MAIQIFSMEFKDLLAAGQGEYLEFIEFDFNQVKPANLLWVYPKCSLWTSVLPGEQAPQLSGRIMFKRNGQVLAPSPRVVAISLTATDVSLVSGIDLDPNPKIPINFATPGIFIDPTTTYLLEIYLVPSVNIGASAAELYMNFVFGLDV